MSERVAIILAAGVSSRMKTSKPKVLHEVCGRPMLDYVLDACRAVGVSRMYVVVGFGSDMVKQRFAEAEDIVWVQQDQQKGTAHAVLCCSDQLKDFGGQTLLLCGDMPLVRAETLEALIDKHENSAGKVTLATAELDDPTGYGRIARDDRGNILGIIEHNDCTAEQLKINEVNPSYYMFDNQTLFELASKIEPNNVKNEYYITDAVSLALSAGIKVEAVTAVRPEEAMGVNSRAHLSEIGRVMRLRTASKLMDQGVTIVDPENTQIDVRAVIGKDTIIEPFTCIRGEVRIGENCRIGPFACVEPGTVIEDGTEVKPGFVISQGS